MIVNGTELAKELGISKGRVSQLVKAKKLTTRKDGKFDQDKAKAEYYAYQGEGRGFQGQTDNAQLQELITLKLENARAKLEIQQATVELQRLKAQIAKGELINVRAASLLYAQIIWKLYQAVDVIPMQTLHLVCRDAQQIATVDTIYRDSVKRVFHSVLSDPALGKHIEYVSEKGRIMAELCETQITLDKRQGRDSETLESCREFAREIHKLFAAMKPEQLNVPLPGAAGKEEKK